MPIEIGEIYDFARKMGGADGLDVGVRTIPVEAASETAKALEHRRRPVLRYLDGKDFLALVGNDQWQDLYFVSKDGAVTKYEPEARATVLDARKRDPGLGLRPMDG